jgi:hypothetical protein
MFFLGVQRFLPPFAAAGAASPAADNAPPATSTTARRRVAGAIVRASRSNRAPSMFPPFDCPHSQSGGPRDVAISRHPALARSLVDLLC